MQFEVREHRARAQSERGNLLQRSSIYREYLAEREEILKHKWCESEKAGRDIGFEHALTDWVIRHRANWRRTRRAQRN